MVPTRAEPEIEIQGGIQRARVEAEIDALVVASPVPGEYRRGLEPHDVDRASRLAQLLLNHDGGAFADVAGLRENREPHRLPGPVVEHAVAVAIGQAEACEQRLRLRRVMRVLRRAV